MIIINPSIITKPLRDSKTREYKNYSVILVGCFIQYVTVTKQIQTKSEPEGRILHIYPDRMELKRIDKYYNLITKSSHRIPKEVMKILEGIWEVEDDKRVYIERLVK